MRWIKWLIGVALCVGAGIGGGVYVWRGHALVREAREVEVRPGDSAREVARAIGDARIINQWVFLGAARLSGKARSFRPGFYAVQPGLTLQGLIERMARGDVERTEVRFVEGWTFRQIRAMLAGDADLRHTLGPMDDRQVLAAIGATEGHPEGLFFPDTYVIPKGSNESVVLKLAYQTMKDHLAAVWQARDPGTPLRTPYEALILASIVEKETGSESDRALVGAVFINRLKTGMKLQADPTVIYGVGTRFDGNLRRSDLVQDTPYNTYVRTGLPPTPISMPGERALMAATQRPASDVLYFVARGDGTSEFSRNLDDHNRAVSRYQRTQH